MKKKTLIFLSAALLVIVAGGAVFWQLHRSRPAEYAYKNISLTAAQTKADAAQLVSLIESTHPEFSLNDIPAGYPAAKKTFLSSSSKAMSSDDLAWLAGAYLASLRDGHTSISHTQPNKVLQGSYRMTENGLFETDQNGTLTGKKVTAIGGVPVDRIFRTISHYETAENDAAVMMNNTVWSTSLPILKRAGINCDGNAVSIAEQDGTNTYSKNVVFQSSNASDSRQTDRIVDSRRIGDIFYIGLLSCKKCSELDKTVDSLKQALSSGVSRVIIDVRGNSGGDSSACSQLLAAMGMQPPNYGMYRRKSQLAASRYSGITDWGTIMGPSCSTAVMNPRISLAVLTNEFTFSSANMLAVWTQDGKLGTVIGYPSANSPSCYGDVLSFQLKNSGVIGQVSFKRWLRPDVNADQRMLHPDIPVAIGDDALKAAVGFLDRK